MVCITKLFTAGLLASTAAAVPVNSFKRSNSTSPRTKVGAAYNDASLVSALSNAGGISWAYNWASTSNGPMPPGVQYVPMLWGANSFTGWTSALTTALSSGSQYIMGFNEPDMTSQANMSPQQAASYYAQYITPYAGQAKLISPAVTSSTQPGMGLSWFSSFMSSCSKCAISGLAVHWYGNNAQQFQSFVSQAVSTARQYGLSEVWVTEFALLSDINGGGNPATTQAFLKQVQPWLDKQPAVTHYAYFMCANNYLLSGTTLNSVGQTYISAT